MPTIVGSLWSVDDRGTAFLMTSFYRHLKTMPKAEALRKAQVETMQKFPPPFFWSCFVMFGDYE